MLMGSVLYPVHSLECITACGDCLSYTAASLAILHVSVLYAQLSKLSLTSCKMIFDAALMGTSNIGE
jgi:hypothetical protein